jgi:hypothetical protein
MGQHSQLILYVQWLLSHLVGIFTNPVAEILLLRETRVMRTSLITHKEILNFILNQTSHKFMTKNCAAD